MSSSGGTSVIRPAPGRDRGWPSAAGRPGRRAAQWCGGPVSWPVNFTRTNRRMRTSSGPGARLRAAPRADRPGDVLVVLGRYGSAGRVRDRRGHRQRRRRRPRHAGRNRAQTGRRAPPLGDWELAEAHLAIVTELVEEAEPGRLARAEADRAVVAYRRGDTSQAAVLGQARPHLRPGRR